MNPRSYPSAPPRRGAVAVLAAFCLVLVIAFVAFSVDWGYVAVSHGELQNAADAAALSGARALVEDRSAAIAAAQLWASKNTVAGQSVATVAGEDVEIGRWNDESASFIRIPPNSRVQPDAVRVTCRRSAARGNPLNLFFAQVLGTAEADLTASAVAVYEREACGMIVGLEYVDVRNGQIDSYNSSLGPYAATRGDRANVCSDGPITINNGMIFGDARPGPGYTVNRPSRVTGSTEPRKVPIRWEPVDLAGADLVNLNNLLPPLSLLNGRLSVNGLLTLIPGTYYFPRGMELAGSSRLVITGPTRIVLGGNSSISGNGIVNPTGVPAKLRIDVIDGSLTVTGRGDLRADIYGPTADIRLNGNGTIFGAVFARRVTLGGAATRIHGDEAMKRSPTDLVRARLKE